MAFDQSGSDRSLGLAPDAGGAERPLLLGGMAHPGASLGLLRRAQSVGGVADRRGDIDLECRCHPTRERRSAVATAVPTRGAEVGRMTPADPRRRRMLGMGAGLTLAGLPMAAIAQSSPRATDRAMLSAAAFGARGDGTTDDTAALQAALDRTFAPGGPGFLVIPPGTYREIGRAHV